MTPRWVSSGAITDPEFFLTIQVGEEPRIVETPTRMDLFNGSVILIFDGGCYYCHTNPSAAFPHDALRYFLTYQTRVNYNVIYPHLGNLHATPTSDEVTFTISRISETEKTEPPTRNTNSQPTRLPSLKKRVRLIDIRRLLEKPASRQLFQTAVHGTRQAIDAYFAHLRAQNVSQTASR